MGYYFKDELHQDQTVVEVQASLWMMFGDLGTPEKSKHSRFPLPEAGSPRDFQAI